MGLGIALLFWLVIALLAAITATAIWRRVGSFVLPRAAPDRNRILRLGAIFPFACLAWAGCVFVFYAVVNDSVLHRGIGTGDVFQCPLPSGYELICVDDTTIGRIEPIDRGVVLDWVRELQFSGPWMLAASDTQWFKHKWPNPSDATRDDRWHIVDTRTQRDEVFISRADFAREARRLGVALHLEPLDAFYARNRFTWIDALAGFLLLAVPTGFLLIFVRRILRSRATR